MLAALPSRRELAHSRQCLSQAPWLQGGEFKKSPRPCILVVIEMARSIPLSLSLSLSLCGSLSLSLSLSLSFSLGVGVISTPGDVYACVHVYKHIICMYTYSSNILYTCYRYMYSLCILYVYIYTYMYYILCVYRYVVYTLAYIHACIHKHMPTW